MQTTAQTAPKTRSRDALVADLKRLADGPSAEFWAWWWSLEKDDRRMLMDEMEPAQVGR